MALLAVYHYRTEWWYHQSLPELYFWWTGHISVQMATIFHLAGVNILLYCRSDRSKNAEVQWQGSTLDIKVASQNVAKRTIEIYLYPRLNYWLACYWFLCIDHFPCLYEVSSREMLTKTGDDSEDWERVLSMKNKIFINYQSPVNVSHFL